MLLRVAAVAGSVSMPGILERREERCLGDGVTRRHCTACALLRKILFTNLAIRFWPGIK
jgi:hypothetical protein